MDAIVLSANAERPNPALPAPPARLVAPLWHTALFVAIVVALAAAGALFQHGSATAAGATTRQPLIPLYLSLIALEYGFVILVLKGTRRTGVTLRDLVGGRWANTRDVLRDVAFAALLWILWTGVALVWQRLHPATAARSISPMLPRTAAEVLLWIVLSMSAAFAEEIAFRGYLQRQAAALTGSIALAIVLQAAVFGIAHGYQGVEACLRIAAYGALFGALAAWRGTLRAGMIAHAWTDIAAGVLRI